MRFERTNRSLLASLLVLTMAAGLIPALAQQPLVARLNILILEGEGAINNVKARTARETIVEVRDENDRPVAGAVIVFMLPGNGPSGAFTDGSRVLMTTANAQGRATAILQPNSLQGAVKMRVTASFQGQSASTTVNMTNALPAAAPASSGATGSGLGAAKIVAVVAGVAAAAGAGIALGTRGNGNRPVVINDTGGSVGRQ